MVSAAVVYELTHSPLWAAAIGVARKLWGTVRALSDDEVEIIDRIRTAARGDLYRAGAREQDLERSWPDDTALLHERLDALQAKGVLTKRRDRWTVRLPPTSEPGPGATQSRRRMTRSAAGRRRRRPRRTAAGPPYRRPALPRDTPDGRIGLNPGR